MHYQSVVAADTARTLFHNFIKTQTGALIYDERIHYAYLLSLYTHVVLITCSENSP